MIRWLGAAFLALAVPGLVAQNRAPQESLPSIDVTVGAAVSGEATFAVALPPSVRGEHFQLRAADGAIVSAQVTRDRKLVFALPDAKAGDRHRFRIEPALEPRGGVRVEALRRGEAVELKVDGAPVLTYRGEKTELPRPEIKPIFRRGGYIHPVLTPQGRLVTDDYAPDHLHHHGIWFAWTRTQYQGRRPDFWNMGDGTGTVEFEAILDTWSGPIQAGVRARHRYVDLAAPAPVDVLADVWEITVHALGREVPGRTGRPYRAFDLVSRHEMLGRDPLVLPEYHYGGLGLRGHRTWLGPQGTRFLTSEGKTRVDGHATRARWCVMGGQVDGRPVGIAVFDHPENFRHPQGMRIHPNEPFFSYAPMQQGLMEIRPGVPYVSRYRFIVFDGLPDAAWLDGLWRAWAAPGTATVS